MAGSKWRQVFATGVCVALSVVVSCGEGRAIDASHADAGSNEASDDGSDDEPEQTGNLCSPTIGSCMFESSASCPALQPGNDLACTTDGAICHYCPVYNRSVSLSRCAGGRWVNTRATCGD
jgi:hypothetical protein